MLLDGYWKHEIKKSISSIRRWHWLSGVIHGGWIEHQLNKQILLSGIVVRKIIEDEDNAKKEIEKTELPMPPFRILCHPIEVTAYPFVGDKDWIIERVIADNYGYPLGTESLSLKVICNQIVHAFVWGLPHESKKDRIIGFLVASDREKDKKIYLVSFDNWIEALKFCYNNCNI